MKIVKFVFILFLLVQYNFLFANMAEPPQPPTGTIIGTSPMKNIIVLHEDLTMNFKDLATGGLVHVDAKYKINCLTKINLLDLVFVANNLNEKKYNIYSDNKLVDGKIMPMDSTIPHTWLPPTYIPFKNGEIPYKYSYYGLFSFKIDSLTLGEHILEVSYDALASTWFGGDDDLAQLRTLVYILKPSSNSWKSFGSLNLNVILPESWNFYSNLPLTRQHGNVLNGTFPNLPADYVSFVIHKSTSLALIASLSYQLGCWLVVALLSFWLISLVSKSKIAGKISGITQISSNVFISLFITVAFYTIFFTHYPIITYILGNDTNPLLGSGMIYFIFISPAIWIIAFIIILIVSYFNTKRLRGKM